MGLFQSTLPREERQNYTDGGRHRNNFNPRSHERSDTEPKAKKREYNPISIHAPTRGATMQQAENPKNLKNFNPRSHERSDCNNRILDIPGRNFNPRSHERSDEIDSVSYQGPPQFQSTLPREERLIVIVSNVLSIVFQSTLPREERQHANDKRGKPYNFNPRSHERSDKADRCTSGSNGISIHAPTRGATLTPCLRKTVW